MKCILALLLVSYLVANVLAAPDAHWSLFKSQFNKNYQHPAEDALRKDIFSNNKAKIEEFNANLADKLGYRKSVNQFTDLTEEERNQLNGFKLPSGFKKTNDKDGQEFLESILNDDSPVPEVVDWRKIPGRVSEVKNQGSKCGSCWAFSTTGLLEGQERLRLANFSLNGDKLIELSEQQLVDCSSKNAGCQGGIMEEALRDIATMKGIESEKDYPYRQRQEKCYFEQKKVVFTDASPIVLQDGDEEAVKKVVARYGPVSVAIDATNNLYDYASGVFKDGTCTGELDHAVLIVGYGTDSKSGDYWILKNSWGKEWGMNGYMLMPRNKFYCGMGAYSVIAKF